MSLQKIRNLAITKVQWNCNLSNLTLGFTLSDGKTCRAGTSFDFDRRYVFKQSKKITKIVTTIDRNEYSIQQIKFFSGEKLLCEVGHDDDSYTMKNCAGRVVAFEITDDE